MKVCIYGAGAIGGYLGAMLAHQGDAEISLIARGPHLEAIQQNGLQLNTDGDTIICDIQATDNPADLGVQDYVILALKAHSISAVMEAIQPLLGPQTVVITAQNGVPWWYFYALEGPYENTRVKAVDTDNTIWNAIGPERVIGSVVYIAAEISSPGVINHVNGNRFPLGEPTGERTERATTLSKILIAAGIKAPVRQQIRNDIWVKLWGNLSFNPISALTGATLEQICAESEVCSIAKTMMLEAQIIGEALGVIFPINVDRRIEGASKVGAHKTSMLVDLETGRPMEIDALVTAVQELGQITGTPTPVIDIVLALVRQRGRCQRKIT